MNVKNYLFFVFLQNHKNLNKYVAGVLSIKKRVSNNSITGIRFGKSLNDNYTYNEARLLLKKYMDIQKYNFNSKNTDISYLITDTTVFDYSTHLTVLKRDVFNIKDEELAIRNYMSIFYSINKGTSKKTPQRLELGNGVMLKDGDRTKMKLDYGVVNPITVATILALQVARENKATELLKALEE